MLYGGHTQKCASHITPTISPKYNTFDTAHISCALCTLCPLMVNLKRHNLLFIHSPSIWKLDYEGAQPIWYRERNLVHQVCTGQTAGHSCQPLQTLHSYPLLSNTLMWVIFMYISNLNPLCISEYCSVSFCWRCALVRLYVLAHILVTFGNKCPLTKSPNLALFGASDGQPGRRILEHGVADLEYPRYKLSQPTSNHSFGGLKY